MLSPQTPGIVTSIEMDVPGGRQRQGHWVSDSVGPDGIYSRAHLFGSTYVWNSRDSDKDMWYLISLKIRKLQAQYLTNEESLRKTEWGSELGKPWMQPSINAPSDRRKCALSCAAICALMLLPQKIRWHTGGGGTQYFRMGPFLKIASSLKWGKTKGLFWSDITEFL